MYLIFDFKDDAVSRILGTWTDEMVFEDEGDITYELRDVRIPGELWNGSPVLPMMVLLWRGIPAVGYYKAPELDKNRTT